jgi:predicted aspartyl protease
MTEQGQPIQSFTVKGHGILKVLRTPVQVGVAFDHVREDPPPLRHYSAIWDTGATGSVITTKVVTECGLKRIGLTRVDTASDSKIRPVYLISILCPNRAGFSQVRVTLGDIKGADVLIGMDIISKGDFAVTNSDGKTTFSFRSPSIECIDFVKQPVSDESQEEDQFSEVGRNDPCPCGSGKKYKQCCLRKRGSRG